MSDIPQVWEIELSETQIAHICKYTLEALAYLHDNCIIHRDIKGANILLTDDGKVKLIDFGVSAVCLSKDEKRNTLSGTPYWMAPEIISNKSGKSPYDEKIDIWSLGITCIELAEKDPPLSELHPMRALMQIPMRDPPFLKNPKKWSSEFQDFIKQCLIKEPSKRPTATELLKHPFIEDIDLNQNPLIPLIQETRKARQRVAAEESMDGSSDSETQKEPSSARNSMEVNDEISDIEEQSSSTVTAGEVNKKASPVKKSPTVRATLNKPNVTKREIEFQQAKIMNKNLVLQQLKLLSEQRSQDIKELDRLKKNLKRESYLLEHEYRQFQQKVEKENQNKLLKLNTQHSDTRDSLLRQHHSDSKSLSRNSLSDEKQKLKDVKDKQKHDLNEYREQLKSKRKEQEKEFKDSYKKKKEEHKSLGKKEKVQAEKELKHEQMEFTKQLDNWEALSILKFTLNQSVDKLFKEQEMTIRAVDHSHTRKEGQLNQVLDTLSKHVHERQLCEWTCENEIQDMETNFLKRRIALQVVHLEKEQALSTQQLERVQVIERNQQLKLLKSDQRAKQKEWNKKRQSMLKDFLKTQKDFTQQNKKEMNKGDMRVALSKQRESFDSKMKENDESFKTTQEREIRDEETWLSQHHEQQRENLANDQKQELEVMTKEHQKTLNLHADTQKKTMDILSKRHFEEKLELLKSNQKKMLELLSKQVAEKVEMMNQHLEEYNTLAKSNQSQLVELMNSQDRTKEEIDEAINDTEQEITDINKDISSKIEAYEKETQELLAKTNQEYEKNVEEMKTKGIQQNLYDTDGKE